MGILIFLILFATAVAVDIPVSNWVHHSGLSDRMKTLPRMENKMLRAYGIFWISTALATVLLFLADHKKGVASPWLGKRASILLLSGIFSLSNQIVKWIVGRFRPFHGDWAFTLHPFYGGLRGVVHAEGPLSFPSGDVTLAFAMTTSLCWALPKFSLLWWLLGLWIALERILEGAHYPSDTVAGAALGIAMALAARRIVESRFNKINGGTVHAQ